MAWTAAEEARILAIEQMLNNLQTAVRNLASKQQIRQLLLLKQTEVDNLTSRVAELEVLVAVLQQQIS